MARGWKQWGSEVIYAYHKVSDRLKKINRGEKEDWMTERQSLTVLRHSIFIGHPYFGLIQYVTLPVC